MYSRLDYVMPATMAVSTTMARQHATADDPTDVELFRSYIATATEYVENYIGQALITRDITWTLSRDVIPNWVPYSTGGYPLISPLNPWGTANRWIPLPRQASAVTSVTFKSWDGSASDVVLTAGSDYQVDLASYVTRIRFCTFEMNASALQVVFTSGYGPTEASIPASIKHAIMLITTSLKFNRGDGSFDPISPAVENLLGKYRTTTFGAVTF